MWRPRRPANSGVRSAFWRASGTTLLACLRHDASGAPPARRGTGLGDLRAALERVERPAALLGLRRLLAERLQRLIRKPDLEQVTGRDRVIATDHNDGREHLLQGPG